ncbi:hypothetical protein QO003_003091 [Arthrobacter silviterrae]|uniref:Uncharacterized protein n=1 Tax=Arthrobacter silviterrae TaxID=2026658 RepID=A0ABX0DI47_9MICC|nr:hypothetical protein [Arthrobacter silviterrae]MDQ0278788.1 hypothetical protein [Arthrobacter silviterrae]NGN83958.1 hypothetical protein [Arthrobacter silviterrae]
MDTNPMVKPHIATTPMVVMTTIAAVILVCVAAIIVLAWPPKIGAWIALAIVVVAAAFLTWRWASLIRKKSEWQRFSDRQWEYLTRTQSEQSTTAVITVLEFREVQPTGVWATIRWEKFGYVQPAWIEPCTFAIWPKTALLIRPDPTQIQVGAPWPPTYYLRSHNCLAIAPALSTT